MTRQYDEGFKPFRRIGMYQTPPLPKCRCQFRLDGDGQYLTALPGDAKKSGTCAPFPPR
jgi:hypothetical protein